MKRSDKVEIILDGYIQTTACFHPAFKAFVMNKLMRP